ncbi:MAG: transposase [Phycisphaerae bacterium]|nr:transposase [Phycisphaerae bacterium]
MTRARRRFGKEQKAAILKRYLVDKAPLSDLCDEFGIKPNQIYGWQKTLFDHAEAAFEPGGGKPGGGKAAGLESEIAKLQAKLARKNEVISELMEENVRAKKEFGER